VTKCVQVEVTVPDCVQYILVKCQRTVRHHAENFQFISRSYSAASDDVRLWQLRRTESLSSAKVDNFTDLSVFNNSAF